VVKLRPVTVDHTDCIYFPAALAVFSAYLSTTSFVYSNCVEPQPWSEARWNTSVSVDLGGAHGANAQGMGALEANA
jgi:hypothetical protein